MTYRISHLSSLLMLSFLSSVSLPAFGMFNGDDEKLPPAPPCNPHAQESSEATTTNIPPAPTLSVQDEFSRLQKRLAESENARKMYKPWAPFVEDNKDNFQIVQLAHKLIEPDTMALLSGTEFLDDQIYDHERDYGNFKRNVQNLGQNAFVRPLVFVAYAKTIFGRSLYNDRELRGIRGCFWPFDSFRSDSNKLSLSDSIQKIVTIATPFLVWDMPGEHREKIFNLILSRSLSEIDPQAIELAVPFVTSDLEPDERVSILKAVLESKHPLHETKERVDGVLKAFSTPTMKASDKLNLFCAAVTSPRPLSEMGHPLLDALKPILPEADQESKGYMEIVLAGLQSERPLSEMGAPLQDVRSLLQHVFKEKRGIASAMSAVIRSKVPCKEINGSLMGHVREFSHDQMSEYGKVQILKELLPLPSARMQEIYQKYRDDYSTRDSNWNVVIRKERAETIANYIRSQNEKIDADLKYSNDMQELRKKISRIPI